MSVKIIFHKHILLTKEDKPYTRLDFCKKT